MLAHDGENRKPYRSGQKCHLPASTTPLLLLFLLHRTAFARRLQLLRTPDFAPLHKSPWKMGWVRGHQLPRRASGSQLRRRVVGALEPLVGYSLSTPERLITQPRALSFDTTAVARTGSPAFNIEMTHFALSCRRRGARKSLCPHAQPMTPVVPTPAKQSVAYPVSGGGCCLRRALVGWLVRSQWAKDANLELAATNPELAGLAQQKRTNPPTRLAKVRFKHCTARYIWPLFPRSWWSTS